MAAEGPRWWTGVDGMEDEDVEEEDGVSLNDVEGVEGVREDVGVENASYRRPRVEGV